MEARRTPARIGQAHFPDQVDDFMRDCGSTLPMAALPTPIQPEPPPVPGDDRFRFEDEESRSPASPELREPSPEDAIGDAKLYSVGTVRALKNQKLMAEGEDLRVERGPISKT